MSESDGVSDRVGSRQTLLSFLRTKKGIRRKLTGFGFSGLFYFLLLSRLNKFFVLVIFFAVPPQGFGFRFRRGTGLISDDWRASAEVKGEKLAELKDG